MNEAVSPIPPLPSGAAGALTPVLTAMAGHAPAFDRDVDAPAVDPAAHW